jgi:hypothetical protein
MAVDFFTGEWPLSISRRVLLYGVSANGNDFFSSLIEQKAVNLYRPVVLKVLS